MDRINGADTIDIGGGRRGFRDENLAAGAAGTEVTALWLNMLQEEILKVTAEAGLAPSEGDWTQLWQALQNLGLAPDRARRWLGVNSMTLSSAPGAPLVGDAYLVPAGATGIWAGNVGKIALWSGSTWTYMTPADGHGISLPDGRVFERVGGTYVEKIALDSQSGKWSYAIAGGTANAITASLSPAPASLVAGLTIRLKIATNNTGPATLNLNGLGAVPIVSSTGKALVEGDLVGVVTLIYTGTSWAMAASNSLFPTNTVSFSVPGTSNWTVPDGCFKARVRLWAGGGGGGGGAPSAGVSYAGTGGGGGGYAEAVVSVTPGSVIPVTVGAGGTAGPAQSAGGTGGTSSFGAVLSATGGTRGVYEPASGTQERAGGMGSGPGLNLRAGNGGIVVRDGNTGNALGGPGGNAAGGGGQGGVLSSAAPSNGAAPGGGGGGAGGPGGFAGGAGAPGLVIIEF